MWNDIRHSSCMNKFCMKSYYTFYKNKTRIKNKIVGKKMNSIFVIKMIDSFYVATTALKTHLFFCMSAGQMNAWMMSDRLSDIGCRSCLSGRSKPVGWNSKVKSRGYISFVVDSPKAKSWSWWKKTRKDRVNLKVLFERLKILPCSRECRDWPSSMRLVHMRWCNVIVRCTSPNTDTRAAWTEPDKKRTQMKIKWIN